VVWFKVLMKPKRCENIEDKNGWIYQYKFDGSRVVINRDKGGFEIKTTRGLKKNKQLPEITLNTLNNFISSDSYTIDGEIVDTRGFNKLIQRLHTENEFKIKMYAKDSHIKIYIFDILELNGEDLRSLPLERRLAILGEISKKTAFLETAQVFRKPIFEEAVAQGYEGIVAKKLSSSYKKGKRPEWLKQKVSFTEDVRVLGHEAGKDTGTFITENGRVNCPSHKVLETYRTKKPTHLEVSFQEKTENGYRFPVLERLRWKD